MLGCVKKDQANCVYLLHGRITGDLRFGVDFEEDAKAAEVPDTT